MENKLESWEREFDEMTGLEMVGTAETYTKHTDPLEVKGFIRLLLSRQKQKMAKALVDAVDKRGFEPFDADNEKEWIEKVFVNLPPEQNKN